MSEYLKQAEDFCKKHGVAYTIKRDDSFQPITEGYGYKVTLKRYVNGKPKMWTIKFSDSAFNRQNGLTPNIYDVLSCIEKQDVGYFEDFCSEFGYDMYDDFGRINKANKKIYNAVVKEYYNCRRMFDDCMDELCEIC